MLVCILAVASAIGTVALAASLFRKLGRGTDDRDPGGPSTGHAGAMLSALFLLVFAIAIIVPWTTADAARQNTYAEGEAAVQTYWASTALPAPAASAVQAQLRGYLGFVLDKEWPLMADGRLSLEGSALLNGLRSQVTGLSVTGDEARDAKSAVLDALANLSAARHQRAADARTTPPAGVMALTILTGVVVIVFPFLAGARPRGMAIVPLVTMAALLGVGTYLAWDISHVFSGGLAVKPEALRAAAQEIQRIPQIPETPEKPEKSGKRPTTEIPQTPRAALTPQGR
ncbi:DUF4239 domain-containing protein [Microtetraspora sp. NBRC 16547]|uniref:bestrophin-like domain n=1 Tax=Microtetraspora sp. NBRC 16547 TaxID=3030993 RepID=UPI0024A13790|nr:DUF4239 domain-containing protein [Microtetraspora sp. NBRC 16547]GLW98164.1 hypothetical protein Misp02_22510 [Microtetraspora sp. NBRC 16547]